MQLAKLKRRITGSVDGFAQKYDNFWPKIFMG